MRPGDSQAEAFGPLAEILKKKRPAAPGERCDYCGTPLAQQHSHLIDLEARRILCACRPCYLVFEPAGAARGRYKPIPDRYVRVEPFELDAATWETLAIPIGLAFFFRNSAEKKIVAFYPGPAGATESLLDLDGWAAIEAEHPVLASLQPDVEAVLIDRRSAPARCFIVPIDAAYQLVGLMRIAWRGFDGGVETQAKIETFFAMVASRCEGRVISPIH